MKTIPLTNSSLVIEVDDEDYLYLALLGPWNLCKEKYPQRNQRPHEFMSNIFKAKLGIAGKDRLEHADRNKLNYQKFNLRKANDSQNNMNREKRKGEYTSKYKGVHYNSRLGKFTVHIALNKKIVHLGCFAVEEDAARAYNEAAKIYFKEFALLNEVD